MLKVFEKCIKIRSSGENTLLLKSACESLDLKHAQDIITSCVDDWKPSTDSANNSQPDIQLNLDNNSDVAEC